MIEIRWHARAGQGAKTAAQLFAEAMLRTGRSVQAFPEYGPERRGVPMRTYTRVDDRPVRRHDAVVEPDVVVVLDPSLVGDPAVTEGLPPGGLVVVNSERTADDLRPAFGSSIRVVPVPAARIARAAGTQFVNVVMLGAVAAALGEPPLEDLLEAARELIGQKRGPEAVEAACRAIEEGHRAAVEGAKRWAA